MPVSSPTTNTCAACGTSLRNGYYFLADRPERYCATCMTQRPRCDSCAAPVGRDHWQLHDGRVLCATCNRTAIYEYAAAQRVYAETVAAVVADLGLSLRIGVTFRLVDAPTLASIRAEDDPHSAAERTLGLYQRQGSLRVIYVLYGLPLLMFRTVVAHEYAHAWEGETCPLLDDDDLREGFAEWVAHRHLRYLGCAKAASRMETATHPYQPLLKQVLHIEQTEGASGVLRHMLAAGRGEQPRAYTSTV